MCLLERVGTVFCVCGPPPHTSQGSGPTGLQPYPHTHMACLPRAMAAPPHTRGMPPQGYDWAPVIYDDKMLEEAKLYGGKVIGTRIILPVSNVLPGTHATARLMGGTLQPG